MAGVTDENPTPQTPDTPKNGQPAPVTVVGYPDLPPAPSPQAIPGLASIRMGVSTARAIAIAALVLVVFLIIGAVLGFAVLRGQVSTLSAQVTALQDEQAQLLDQIENQPAPTAAGDGQQQEQQQQGQTEASVAQLPAAPALPSEIPIPKGLDESGAVLVGDPDANNVVEVYLDYQCPYCKAAEPRLRALVESDGNIRHVIKDFPILGPVSVVAARAALASQMQGKHQAFHNALMDHRGRLTESIIFRTAESVGLDVARLRKDMDAPEVANQIIENFNLARSLKVSVTPGYFVDTRILSGASVLTNTSQIDFGEEVAAARAAN